jgi:hypothetical protein
MRTFGGATCSGRLSAVGRLARTRTRMTIMTTRVALCAGVAAIAGGSCTSKSTTRRVILVLAATIQIVTLWVLVCRFGRDAVSATLFRIGERRARGPAMAVGLLTILISQGLSVAREAPCCHVAQHVASLTFCMRTELSVLPMWWAILAVTGAVSVRGILVSHLNWRLRPDEGSLLGVQRRCFRYGRRPFLEDTRKSWCVVKLYTSYCLLL